MASTSIALTPLLELYYTLPKGCTPHIGNGDNALITDIVTSHSKAACMHIFLRSYDLVNGCNRAIAHPAQPKAELLQFCKNAQASLSQAYLCTPPAPDPLECSPFVLCQWMFWWELGKFVRFGAEGLTNQGELGRVFFNHLGQV